MPSSKLQSLSSLPIGAFNLLHERGVRNLLPVPFNKNILRSDAVFNGSAEDHGRVFFIKLHHIAGAVHLLTRHHRGAGAAEGVKHNGVLLRGVADGIAQQVERL